MSRKVELTIEKMGELNSGWEMSKCPFCFANLTPFGTCYRAASRYTQMDLDNGTLTDEQKKYVAKLDKKYVDFTEDKAHGIKAPLLHISEDMFDDEDNGIVCNNYEVDDDYFPCGIYDTLGNRSSERVCPQCHNTLPKEYGKYPVIFVAVVGVTKSGKTVYLSQLLQNINRYLPQLNLSISGLTKEMDEFISTHKVQRVLDYDKIADYKLPDGTTAAIRPQPIPMTIKNNETEEIFTIIFYDIAGENCVDPSKMDKFGPFIKNSNAFLMVIDPTQFADVFNLNVSSGGAIRPEMVVQTIHDSFLADSENQFEGVPFAITFSKNDMLFNFFEENNIPTSALKPINYAAYGRDSRGLALNDFMKANGIFEKLLREDVTLMGQNFLNIVLNHFKNYKIFSFSALGIEPMVATDDQGSKFYYLNTDPLCVRVEEPLAWLLWQLGVSPAVRLSKKVKKKLFGEDEVYYEADERYAEPMNPIRCGGTVAKRDVDKNTDPWF